MTEITIVMPVFNGMPYLPFAVESILRQTLSDWRFIIVDDGSTDGTSAYLAGLGDPRIRIEHRTNSGPAAATNYALSLVDTPLLARMDADDISHPTRLEQQRAFLLHNPGVGLVGTQFEPLGAARTGRGSKLATRHEQIYEELIHGRHAMCNPTIMCRTELLKRIGGYHENGALEDWAMFLEMGRISKLANLDEVLLSYRVHNSHFNGQRIAEVRTCIAYACHRARQIEAGQTPLSYEEFVKRRGSEPAWRQFFYRMEANAMGRYRLAQSEILGDHPLKGYVQLGIAACLSPSLTLHRLKRSFNPKSGEKT